MVQQGAPVGAQGAAFSRTPSECMYPLESTVPNDDAEGDRR